MTKLGTPIGAGPKGAIVVVGLALVGEPPCPNCEPPSGPFSAGWSPAVALGALTPPPSPAVAVPRLWFRWTPPVPPVAASEASRAAPVCTSPLGCGWAPPPVVGSSGASFPSEADSQSGSSRSTRPSPSSSASFAQTAACGEGSAGAVVIPLAAWPSPSCADGSAPAMPTPSAVATAKPARAMVSASFCLMRRRLGPLQSRVLPVNSSPQASSTPTLLACARARNAVRRPPTCP